MFLSLPNCKWLVQPALEASVYLPQDPHSGVPFESESSRAGEAVPQTEGIKDETEICTHFFKLPRSSCTQSNCDFSAKTSSRRRHLRWPQGMLRISIKSEIKLRWTDSWIKG